MSWVNFETGGVRKGGGKPSPRDGGTTNTRHHTSERTARESQAGRPGAGKTKKTTGLRIVAKQLPVSTDSLGSEATARDAHCATSRAQCLSKHGPIYLLGTTYASIVEQFAKCLAHARRSTVQELCCFTRCKI